MRIMVFNPKKMHVIKKRDIKIVIIVMFFFLFLYSRALLTSGAFQIEDHQIRIHPSNQPYSQPATYAICDSSTALCGELLNKDVATLVSSTTQVLCCQDKFVYNKQEGNYIYTLVIGGHDHEGGTSWASVTTPWSPVNFDKDSWACKPDNSNGWRQGWSFCDLGDGVTACCGDDGYGYNPYGTSSNVDDPDMCQAACIGCPKGDQGLEVTLRHWNPDIPDKDKSCCGDDRSDCGTLSIDGDSFFLCSNRPGEVAVTETAPKDCYDEACLPVQSSEIVPGHWYWRDAEDPRYRGVIWESPCAEPDISYLSDGEDWLVCQPEETASLKCSETGSCILQENPIVKSFRLKLFSPPGNNEVGNPFSHDNGHDYLCFHNNTPDTGRQDPLFEIAECCGDETCKNDYEPVDTAYDLGGLNMDVGYSIEFQDKALFCTEYEEITTDLDKTEEACKKARYQNGSSRYFLWTGTMCCAEPEDGEENYNDPLQSGDIGGKGACYRGKPIPEETLYADDPKIIVSGGNLTVCRIEDALGMESEMDTVTGYPLFHKADYCDMTRTKKFICNFSGEWSIPKAYEGPQFSEVKYNNWIVGNTPEKGCCPAGECWTGDPSNLCFGNQKGDLSSPPYRGFRCVNGVWQPAVEKPGLNGEIAYCETLDQCYHNQNCYQHGDWITFTSQGKTIDAYCEEGNWTSRLKLLALTMLKMAGASDYTLYCGPPDETLVYQNYAIEGANLNDALDITNSFCLLSYENKLIFATPLSYHLDEPETADIKELLPQLYECKGPYSESQYYKCGDGYAWYNDDLASVLYSNEKFTIQDISATPQSFREKFFLFLQSLFSPFFKDLQTTSPTNTFAYDFLQYSLRFDRLYMAKNQARQVIATLEAADYKYSPPTITVKYNMDIDTDICKIVNQYNDNQVPEATASTGRITCIKGTNTFNIIGFGGSGSAAMSGITPEKIWTDLTGELRLQ